MPLNKKRKIKAVFSFVETEDSDFSTENSDSDEEACFLLFSKRRPRIRHRQKGYTANVVSAFRLDEFRTFFRVSRLTAQCLKEHIVEICLAEDIQGILCRHSSGGSPQKPLEDRLLMMLWYLASLDKYASIADRFGLSESTACCAVRNLLQFIEQNLCPRIIQWPTEDEKLEISHMYENLKQFPGVVGMIDGSHIQIKRPAERGIDYYNRNNYYSVILQGVVREDLRFIDVFAGFPGKVHDARVFRESALYLKGANNCGEGRHILGDSAYPNLPWLLTPFRDNGHLTAAQKNYNKVHSSIRSNVERAFGLLKARFVRLQDIDQRDIKSVVRTVIAACVMHNICILNHDELDEMLTFQEVQQNNMDLQDFEENEMECGARKRLDIARRLAVPQTLR